MSGFLDDLEHDLVAAARRRGPGAGRRRGPGVSLLAAALFLAVGASAAAGTLTVLRGSPIPAPSAENVPLEQTPAPGSSRVTDLRLADPRAGRPPWTVRVARSRTGLVCATVGQVVEGDFGIVGLDGRFRTLPEGVVDGCGELLRSRASLIGARVFDAERPAAVRTVVNGVAGEDLRSVRVEAGGRRIPARATPGGVFAAVVRGYPEDAGIRVRLAFDDGRVETRTFGTDPWVVPDPAGGRAWRVEAFTVDAKPSECTRFRPARERENPPVSPAVCGELGEARSQRGVYFAVRRLEPDGRSSSPDDFFGGLWRDHPPRTAVWGGAGEDVRRVEVIGPAGTRELTFGPARTFLAVYGPKVRPEQLAVRVTFDDGRTERYRGDTNLVDPPEFGP